MDLRSATRKKKRWVLLFTALGFAGYGVFKLYNRPSMAEKRRRLSKLVGAFLSVAEAVSDSADSVGIVSRDLRRFLESDSDQIPRSLKQVAKLAMSDELSSSVSKLAQGVTQGVLNVQSDVVSGLPERILERVFSPEGSGYASVVVGSLARNLVTGLFENAPNDGCLAPLTDVIFGEKCRDFLGCLVQVSVATAVKVYLEKTRGVNAYNELFSALTDPKHASEVKDIFAGICNGAVETLVTTSHKVITRRSSNETVESGGGSDSGRLAGRMTSALAVPGNRRFVLDVTGRVTFEMVRSVLWFLVERLCDGARRFAGEVAGRGLGFVRYVAMKSSVVVAVCLSLCLHASGGGWLLMPA